MFFPTFSLFLFFLYFGLTPCFARDTITFGNPLNSSGGQLIVSAAGKFALGFFSPDNGSAHRNQYVGIWYHDGSGPKTVVWVVNRDGPPPVSNSTTFGIGEDGNIVLSGTSIRPISSLAAISSPSTRTLKLLDSGNLVLSDVSTSGVVWQSFLHPTDTFLPGMKISDELVLISWRSQLDPSPGSFIFQQDGDNQYIITNSNNDLPYWKSGLFGKFITKDEIPPLLSSMLQNTTGNSKRNITCSIIHQTNNSCKDTRTGSYDYNNTRLVMGSDGKLRFFRRDNQTEMWPRDRCSVFDACGTSGVCNNKNRVPCKCLPGFKPQAPENWNNGDFSEGCIRKYPVCDQHGGKDFLKLSMMKVPKPASILGVNETECRRKCLDTCHCQAYSFSETEAYLRGQTSNYTCSIWTDDLKNFQESYVIRGLDLNLRVPLSETGNRTCGTCGTNIIPYPLSTRPACGDPEYSQFDCQTEYDTGLVVFHANGTTYRVSRIDPVTQKFSIQIKNCSSGDSREKLLHFPPSSPFFVYSSCLATKSNFSVDSLWGDEWFYEVEIGWKTPLEPTCGSSKDCKVWPDSSCNVAADGRKQCTCNRPAKWDPSQASCIREGLESSLNQFPAPAPSKKKEPPYLIFLGVITAMLFVLCLTLAWSLKRRRMLNQRGNLELSVYNSERRVIDFINSQDFNEDDKKDIDVPHFSLESILIATENFAEVNKLGQGGFGPVYKAKLPRGQEIAIKRLSRGSGQGLEEFKNEVVLIAKLQHRNLVRLLGYCVKGYEKMLIYEYMPNKSLDSFIFDRSRIFGGKQIEANTERVVGTYGYMSPEYALDGFFSIKSDVFSFGVVLLETISGKRNTGFYQAEQPLSLLGYTWRLWGEGRALDLAEQSLRETCNENEYLRCVNVGLLCVQEDPSDRPTMSNVLFMLGSEAPSLPIPKRPAYVVRRSLSGSASSSSQQQWNAELSTSTLQEGR
ncbi:hypothetical protein V6N11_074861 [Hibiscus sabdariffa]|uniref:Uncharacterized protein n=1 Tax=Hibiscus sabdariffa TaxID=183260 RepID=A0ABR2R4T7_9ROSI